VDITNSLAESLHDHLNGPRTGFVFRTTVATPLARSNVLRRSLYKILGEVGREKCGFEAFRRYRLTHLRKQPSARRSIAVLDRSRRRECHGRVLGGEGRC
jgi:hypothetical protein